ncbi:MAG TPA: phosphatase PAP2 family protein [Mucilaginibacter sp.]|nr:phosphatase PAP2 family protein [Mucilaginibacter sp.]
MRWMVIPYLVILVICLVIKLTFSRPEIYFAVNGLNTPWADFLAPYITDLGNGWTAIAFAIILLLFSYRKALIVATSYAVTSLFAQVVKYIFDLPRPQLYFGDKIKNAHFVKGVYILSFNSFPSGHTVTAFTLAVLLTYWCRGKAWGIVFLLIAVLVGYSRMYLSEHFFEDVVAGSVIGFVLTVIWLRWLDSRAFIQKPGWQKGLLRLRQK